LLKVLEDFTIRNISNTAGKAGGSLYEIIDHLIVAAEEKYITEKQFQDLRIEIDTCLAVLNGFINYLVKIKTGTMPKNQNSLIRKVQDADSYKDLSDNH
jgi:hypothetical protein